MSEATPVWGEQITIEKIRGIPYRIYSERPRRVESLLAFTARWGERAHVVHGDRVVTFNDLRRMSAGKATLLAAQGIGAGDRVLLLGWNSPDWIANFWACLEVGATPVLGNGWWSEGELVDALEMLRPTMILADAHGAAKVPPGWRCGPWETDPNASVDVSALNVGSQDENEPAAVIFTSGTEGRAKAVVLSHRSLLAGLQMLLHVTRRLPHQLDGAPPDVGLHTGPLFHIGGVQTLLRAVVIGGTLVMPRGRFDPADALALIERHDVTRWSAVPTMISRVLEHPDVHTRDLKTLRSLTVGGAPVHAELLARMRSGLPGIQPRIATGYGLSENGGQATAASGVETTERPGSSGRPLPCVEVRIDPRPDLLDGEVYLRSPTQMLGYYGSEDSPIDAQGWLHTGDLGRLDDEGHLWITGRSKDVIIRGGENISPVAVEKALMAIPAVREAVVFGVAHPDLGEEIMAVVAVKEDVTVQQLQDHLKASLASFSMPSRWRVQSEPLPVNHSSKVDKAAIAKVERALRAEELAKVQA